jgi:formamidopyrimidine-DNA glycosylase
MPELPDVEVFKRYFDSTALHQKIEEVKASSKQVLKGVSSSGLEKELKGRSFSYTDRYGKYLFAHLDGDKAILVLHFGMTGFLKYFKDLEKEPPHDRLLITFKNGYHLACDSQRKLGEIRLIEDRQEFIEKQELGPDAMSISFPDFRDALSDSRASIKSTLMNQQILAGIGNIYSDEILFRTGLHPREKAQALHANRLKTLYDAMKDVLEKGIELRADPDKFPRSFIIPQRSGDGKCPKCSGAVKSEKIAGRTAYYCPKCQKK